MPVPFTGVLQFVVVPPLLPLLLVLPLLPLLPLLLLLPPLPPEPELELHPTHAAIVTATKPVPKRPIREEFILLLQIVLSPMRERMLQPRRSRWRWYIFSAR